MLYILDAERAGDVKGWPHCSIKGCNALASWELMELERLDLANTYWLCQGHALTNPDFRIWQQSYERPTADSLAAKAVPRGVLQARGYRSMLKSSDLFPYGYSVSHWMKPGLEGVEVLEYVPCVGGRSKGRTERFTACCFEQQAAVHRVLGVGVSGRGEASPTNCPMPLFDFLEV